MSKKLVVVLLVCLALALIIAGCNSNEPAPPDDDTEEPDTGVEDDYPSKPVELVVPFGPGGSHDMHSRAIVSTISQYLGGPMIVTLKPGGSGAVGSEYVATSNPDGYTLLFGGSGPNSALHHVRDLPYKREDFVPIAKINHSPTVFVVRADSPFNSLEDIVEYAKEHPGELTYSSSGPFGATHIPIALFCEAAGIDMVHVPFDGGGPALMAVLGGQVDISATMTTQTRPLVEAGDVKALAISDDERLDDDVLGDIPTLQEQGYDVVYKMWRSVLAPKDTPEEVVTHLRDAFRQLVEDPSFIKMIENMGEKVIYLDGPDFQEEWDEEFEKQGPVLKQIAEKEE